MSTHVQQGSGYRSHRGRGAVLAGSGSTLAGGRRSHRIAGRGVTLAGSGSTLAGGRKSHRVGKGRRLKGKGVLDWAKKAINFGMQNRGKISDFAKQHQLVSRGLSAAAPHMGASMGALAKAGSSLAASKGYGRRVYRRKLTGRGFSMPKLSSLAGAAAALPTPLAGVLGPAAGILGMLGLGRRR